MAQLVERYVRNVQATSSNLVISTTIRHRFGGAFFVAEITSCSESCIPTCSREESAKPRSQKRQKAIPIQKLSRRSRRKSRLDCQFPFSSHHHKAPLWRCFFRGGDNELLGIVHSSPRPARGNFFQPAYIDCLHVVLLRRFVKYCSRQILIRS